jgi:hypothetical protein
MGGFDATSVTYTSTVVNHPDRLQVTQIFLLECLPLLLLLMMLLMMSPVSLP